MRPLARIAFAAALLFAPLPLHAQGMPLILELRGVGGWASGDLADDGLDVGYGYGLGGRIQLLPGTSIYGGWERIRFDGDTEGGSGLASTSDTAARAGVELGMTLGRSAWGAFLFGGGVLGETQSEIREDDVTFIVDSGWEIGYEAGAGLSTVFGGITLRPSVAYRSHTAELEAFSGFPGREMTTSYVVVAVGLSPRG